MKQFILFLFFTTLSFGYTKAQDNFEDEFIDPGFQVEPTAPGTVKTEPAPMQIESNEIKSNTSFPTSVDSGTGTEENFAESQSEDKTGAVLLEKQRNLTASYKQRRSRHGLLASITYEKYYPTDYFSQLRDVYIEEIIDTDKIDLVGGELGYKLNFKIGSLALLANYARGSIEGLVGTSKRTLTFKRMGASANIAADNFFEEPWVVPYGQVGIHQFQVEEDDLSSKKNLSTTTSIALNYRFGLLFQLNWIEKSIDPSTQIDGLRSSGLENTFLDVYMANHLASSNTYDPAIPASKGDPDLSSDMELGVGLKLEF